MLNTDLPPTFRLAADLNPKMSVEFIYLCLFSFLAPSRLWRSSKCKLGRAERPQSPLWWFTVSRPDPRRSGLEDPLSKMDHACHLIQLATTTTGAPTYPTLQSPQIRFNQTTCAMWLGVRKRIISKQRSSSPGFIGIRTGLLCRI